MSITFEEFKNYIEEIKTVYDFKEQLFDVCSTFNECSENRAYFEMPTLIDTSIKLLAKLANDKNEWLEYWFFELECGKKSSYLTVEDGNGNNIPLTTIEDLWKIIVDDNTEVGGVSDG